MRPTTDTTRKPSVAAVALLAAAAALSLSACATAGDAAGDACAVLRADWLGDERSHAEATAAADAALTSGEGGRFDPPAFSEATVRRSVAHDNVLYGWRILRRLSCDAVIEELSARMEAVNRRDNEATLVCVDAVRAGLSWTNYCDPRGGP